jgi:hypothetical protein
VADTETEECGQEDGTYWYVDILRWSAAELGYNGGVGASHVDDGRDTRIEGYKDLITGIRWERYVAV